MNSTTYTRIIVAGQDVADKISALKTQYVIPSMKMPGCYDSETLCTFQRKVSQGGYVEAEIVESMYGFSVRYASGLHDFGLIFSARSKEVDGTLEGAIAAAQQWQAADPSRRFVSRTVGE
jgi:hypothetical protein